MMKTMKKVMCEYGGVEISPTLLEDKEKKRVWIKTKPRQEKIRPLAVAVIKKENKVLAIKGYDDIKNQTFYRLPGGGIEFCEKGEKTIKREFMEELGFEPINIKYSKTVEKMLSVKISSKRQPKRQNIPTRIKRRPRFFTERFSQNSITLFIKFLSV